MGWECAPSLSLSFATRGRGCVVRPSAPEREGLWPLTLSVKCIVGLCGCASERREVRAVYFCVRRSVLVLSLPPPALFSFFRVSFLLPRLPHPKGNKPTLLHFHMSPKAASSIAAGAASAATVVQLKAFLTERGLATDGLKADLVERVEAALAAVRGGERGRESKEKATRFLPGRVPGVAAPFSEGVAGRD